MAPCFRPLSPSVLGEDRTYGGGDHLVLGLGHMRQRVAHEVDAAALPARLEDLRDGGLGVDTRSDDGGDGHHPPVLSCFQIGGVQPDIGPFALAWSVEEGIDADVDVLAERRDLAFGYAAHPHGLHEVVNLASLGYLEIEGAQPGLEGALVGAFIALGTDEVLHVMLHELLHAIKKCHCNFGHCGLSVTNQVQEPDSHEETQ